MGFLPGLSGNFLGIQPSGGSDAPLDILAPQKGHFSLRQYCVGSVAAHTYDAADNGHSCGEGEVISFNPDPNATDTYTWPPCTASFTKDTLAGSLLVCVGVLNGDYFGDFVTKVPVVFMDAGLDGWGSAYSFATSSIFNKALGCLSTVAGGITQVPQADGVLLYKANAPVVSAGTLFYGGVNSADWCNGFAYQMILAEFKSDGATLDSFSLNTTVHNPGDPLSLTGRLPSDNPSFVIAITYNNPGNGAAAGSGFTLASATTLGGIQWQWQEFAPQDQPSGYPGASANFPRSCPGLSGRFELGFTGGVVAGITPVGAFIWNVHPAAPSPPSGNIFQPNVCISSS
jgi:hypothetical protein